ncbi:membrane protein DedA, SNARE-associated domain [Saccharopolyspora kobensis]|uniref:Membrane protein DedA, SNARE-associated domain n=1 Tax=Saccharopolyspora kobensis TaxID=146035 RepID=A0A1H6C457_9PSEU|nr:DedA family protein [Saccharopolyspora kobensis]SEG67759.1 membrane protein DedA, SNARE-associated domain [Saccharopolyspora kobensis]SFC27375.1 membrane protein DedA, SNARE-associated domain [Saccharopolyspora kobensis]
MTFISDVLAAVGSLPKPLLVLVTGALVLGECTIGLGFLVPGESGLLIASAAVTDLGFFFVLAGVVAVCATVGDNIGFWLGRRYRLKMRETKVVRKLGQQHWDRAGQLLRKWGIGAVLVGRFLPVVRTLMPAAAGTSGMSYPKFAVSSLIGAIAWSATHVSIGWLAGASAKYIEDALGRTSWILMAAVVVIGVSIWLLRRRRGTKQPEAAAAEEPAKDVAA